MTTYNILKWLLHRFLLSYFWNRTLDSTTYAIRVNFAWNKLNVWSILYVLYAIFAHIAKGIKMNFVIMFYVLIV